MSAKESLLSFLSAYQPSDEKDATDKARMMVYAADLANPLSRTELSAHFTGSCIIVHPDQEQICLVHHGKLKRWMQLGGHGEVEDHGDISATALREGKEESGLEVEHYGGKPCLIDLDIHSIPTRGAEPEHFHLDMRFLLQATTTDLVLDPSESGNIRWVSWEDVFKLVDSGMETIRMIKKAQKVVQSSGP